MSAPRSPLSVVPDNGFDPDGVGRSFGEEPPPDMERRLVPVDDQRPEAAVSERPLIVPEGWMREYVDWAIERTDAPPVFHVAVGLGVLGTVLGNKVSLRLKHGTIFPHLWLVLVAGSSYQRKSTAIGFGSAMLADVNTDLLLPNQFTTEALIAVLAKRQYGQMNASEFGAFMEAIQGKEYNAGGLQSLTELYDAPPVWTREIRKESYELRYPCLSLIGGSTITWLKQQIQADDLAGGFAARLTFWPAERKLPYRRVDLDVEESVSKRGELVAKLKTLARMEPRSLGIDRDALDHYNNWCERHEGEDVPDSLRGLHVRLETAALKIGMVAEASFAIGFDSPPQSVSLASMTDGTRMADQLWENVLSVVEEGLGSTKSFAQVDRIRGICQDLQKKRGPFTYSTLLQRAHMGTKELREIVSTLEDTGELQKMTDAEPGRSRRSELYAYKRPTKS